MAAIYKAPSTNFWSTSLNGAIDSSVTTVTLNSTTGLASPGVLVIDRQDASGVNTPSARELISYTGISGSDLTGVTRAFDGSTNRSHSDGALVESVPTVGMWNDLTAAVAAHSTAAGAITTASAATIANNLTVRTIALTSVASIARVEASTLVSTNFIGLPGVFEWTKSGALVTSLITSTTPMQMLRATRDLTLTSAWMALQSAPSLSAFKGDIKYSSGPTADYTTIFSVPGWIDIGEYTTASSATPATLALTSLACGSVLKPEILFPGDAGDLTIQLVAKER